MASNKTDVTLNIAKTEMLMTAYKISAAQVCSLLGHSKSFFIELRRRGGNIKREDLERIASIFGVTAEELTIKGAIPEAGHSQNSPQNLTVDVNTAEMEDLLGKIYRTEVGVRNELKAVSERLFEMLTEIKQWRKEMGEFNAKNNSERGG